MHTENSITIKGSIDRIYALAADIQDWPSLLPHYRYVNVLEQSDDGNRKVVEMSAVRPDFPLPGVPFPVTWRSVQICEPELHRITFKHIGGVAMGMWVVWELTPNSSGHAVCVTIRHELRYPFAFLNGWFAGRVVGEGFVRNIAGKTLATIKKIVECEQG